MNLFTIDFYLITLISQTISIFIVLDILKLKHKKKCLI